MNEPVNVSAYINRVQGLGFRVQGLGFRAQGFGFWEGLELRVKGSWFSD
jgi:hypothetical protein